MATAGLCGNTFISVHTTSHEVWEQPVRFCEKWHSEKIHNPYTESITRARSKLRGSVRVECWGSKHITTIYDLSRWKYGTLRCLRSQRLTSAVFSVALCLAFWMTGSLSEPEAWQTAVLAERVNASDLPLSKPSVLGLQTPAPSFYVSAGDLKQPLYSSHGNQHYRSADVNKFVWSCCLYPNLVKVTAQLPSDSGQSH